MVGRSEKPVGSALRHSWVELWASSPGEWRVPGKGRVEQRLDGTPRHFDIYFLWPPLSFTQAFLNQCSYVVNHCGMNLTALSPYQALQEQLTSVVQEIGHLIDPIATAARGEAAQLGHKVMCTEGILLRVCVRGDGEGRGY